MKISLGVLIVLACTLSGRLLAAGQPPLPNIVYILADDIGETKNLQAEHPEVVARLTKLLEQQIADRRSTPGAKQTNDTKIVVMKAIAAIGKD